MIRQFLLFLLALLPTWAYAQDEAATHAAMRKSLAYIEVSGQRSNGAPLLSSGTGVLMDEIGHVLTVLHLITDVEGKALDNEFDVTVRVGDRNGPSRPATVIRKDNDRDVLVLRIQTAAEPYQAACFGDDKPPLPRIGELFLTSGFPLDLGYFTGSGKLTTMDGPRGLFGVDIPISSGQSGSPVYDAKGRVVGLMVGSVEGEGVAGQHYYQPLRPVWDVASSFATGECGGEPAKNIRFLSERIQIEKLCNERKFSEAAALISVLADELGVRENVYADFGFFKIWERCNNTYVATEVDSFNSTSQSGLFVNHNGINKAELSGHFWSRVGTDPGLFDVTENLTVDGTGCWIGSFGPEIGIHTEWKCVIRGRGKIGAVLTLPDEYIEIARKYNFYDSEICEVEADFTGANRFELIACYSPQHRKFACLLKPSNTLGHIEDRYISECMEKAAK
ncbi:MAG: serine protease [Alphaproteobacteria bacterium]|nr:serine protease [Alphaproteobacteria bacterium]